MTAQNGSPAIITSIRSLRYREMSRREFLRSCAVLGAIAAFSPQRALATGDHRVISIFNTTDLHGNILPASSYEGTPDLGGFARCAARIRQWRAENPASLLIDCGDVYQGTDVGYRTRGRIMIDLLNALAYDCWVVGNHEFDWGFEHFAAAVERSTMPALCSNVLFEGKTPEACAAGSNAGPMKRIAPHLIKETGGIKIGVVGSTTPGMSAWLHPKLLGIFQVTDPVAPALEAARACRAAGANAVVLAAHMGIRDRGDDHANRIESLAAALKGEVDLILAGHTHRPIETAQVNGIPYCQANYFGIHCGRADLVFDQATKQLVEVKTSLSLMDSSVAPDPACLSLAAADLEQSAVAMAAHVCDFDRPVSTKSAPGRPSEVEELIGAAIREALAERGVHVDGVLHGLFNEGTDIPAGPASVADLWRVIPYENFIVTAGLLPPEILSAMNEIFEGGHRRNLMGFRFDMRPFEGGRRDAMTAVGIRLPDGSPPDPSRRYMIALNSYDGQSGGRRLNRLAQILAAPEARSVLHPIQTREALISYLARHGGFKAPRQSQTGEVFLSR